MKYNIAYKYRLLPNKEQAEFLENSFNGVRFVWNKLLDHAIKSYEENKKTSYLTIKNLRNEHPWLKQLDAVALNVTLQNLRLAYDAFYKKRARLPKFKSYLHAQSYTTRLINNNIRFVGDDSISLPKIGPIKFINHRPVASNESIVMVTLSRTASGKYFISVCVEGEKDVQPVTVQNKTIILSQPIHTVTPEDDAKIALLQRRLQRKKKNSNNYHKHRKKLARYHEYLANKRHDALHKRSHALATQWDEITVPKRNVKKQLETTPTHQAKTIADQSWGIFVNMLKYKMTFRGKKVIEIKE